VEEQKALPGAAAAHGGDGGLLSKSQAPWVFNPMVILVTGQDNI